MKKALTPQFEYNDFLVCYKLNIFNQLAEGYEIKDYKRNDWVLEKIEILLKLTQLDVRFPTENSAISN